MAKEDTTSTSRRRSAASATNAVRARIAQLVWLACVLCALCALVLAVGALLIALDANTSNALVDWVLRAADYVDVGVFSRQDGIKQFRGEGAEVKNALFNWGLAAIAWLVVGRVLERIIKP